MENIIKLDTYEILNQDKSGELCCKKNVASKYQPHINQLSDYKSILKITKYCPLASMFFQQMNN